jgi:hypothetical protein
MNRLSLRNGIIPSGHSFFENAIARSAAVSKTSRSRSAKPKVFLADLVLRLVRRTQPRSEMRIAGFAQSRIASCRIN